MTVRPDSLPPRPEQALAAPADAPAPVSGGIDPLSDVLRTVRLTGAVYYLLDLSSPWGSEVPDGTVLASILIPRGQTVVSYHVVTHGSLWCGLPGEPPIALHEGDVLVLPRGDAYFLSMAADGRPAPAADATLAFFRACGAGRVPFAVAAGGGGAARARLLCGFLGCDLRPFNPVLAALPRLLVLRRATLPTPAADRLDPLVALTVAESGERRPGGECIRLRLAELMFVEVLRRYLATPAVGPAGWLAGLRDDVVGRALALLHDRPAHAWTLQDLADDAGASRSVLAERFARLVGEPPMQYLARWRMQVAARLLSEGNDKVGAVALGVGYDSEAAFSRAFKKAAGLSPAAWRDRYGVGKESASVR